MKKINLKKMVTMALTAVVAVSVINVSAFADEVYLYSETNSEKIEWLNDNNGAFSDTVVFPVIEISENASESEKKEAAEKAFSNILKNNSTEEAAQASLGVVQGTAIFRSGNTTSCELYISWTGTETVSMFAFDEFIIKSASLLSSTVYADIGGSTVVCNPAAKSGYVWVKRIDIPTNVSTVKAIVKSPKVCTLEEGWLYGSALNFSVDIN